MSEAGATADNLHCTWKNIVPDFNLNVINHIGLACDGAAAMFGRHCSLSQKIISDNSATVVVHCYAHRLALACADTVKELKAIGDCERARIQIWSYFSRSPLRTAKLAAVQGAEGRKLVQACKVRWLSHSKAAKAMKRELVSVWMTLEHFAEEKRDAGAIGLMKLTKKSEFLFTLYILDAVLPHLEKLSLLFQGDQLLFAHVTPALESCKAAIKRVTCSAEIAENLIADWPQISALLPNDMQVLNDAMLQKLHELARTYGEALISSLNDRFPHHDIITAFQIFDTKQIPIDSEDRSQFGRCHLDVLLTKFSDVIHNCQSRNKIGHDFETLKDRLVSEEFEFCKNAADVCSKLVNDCVYRQMFPELYALASIALTIPLSNAWPERGFSTLARIKTKQRNRLSGTM